MKVYKIEISSNMEFATKYHDVSANNFGEALKKAKQLKKNSCLIGNKRISSIVETVTILK